MALSDAQEKIWDASEIDNVTEMEELLNKKVSPVFTNIYHVCLPINLSTFP